MFTFARRIHLLGHDAHCAPYASCLVIALLLSTSDARLATAQPPAAAPRMLVGTIEQRPVLGLELVRATNRQIVLGTDGWLHDFDPRGTKYKLDPSSQKFSPLNTLQLREQLLEEFGRNYSVDATAHFLVAYPRGSQNDWPEVFEQLHRTFLTYFTVRDFPIRNGSFPMVAVVFNSKGEMQSHLHRLGIRTGDVLGVYDRLSNRIMMYDHGASAGGVSTTICHEAAHQSAFNTGVHSRLAATPHWMVEGIGCLFQSPAMVRGERNGALQERVDAQLLWQFTQSYPDADSLTEGLQTLIAEDHMFQDAAQVDDAYALSWALTFYLFERRSQAGLALLQHYANLAPFQDYSSPKRASDFSRIVGTDIALLARQMLSFYQKM